MFDTICTLPLSADLFAQAIHPSEPILTVGLSSGHVYAYRLPSIDEEADEDEESSPPPYINGNGPAPIISSLRRSSNASENGLGSIEELWKTRRHKGSCRALCFSHDGNVSYSAGTDGLVKAFDTATGKVISKIAIPLDEVTGDVDAPTVLHALSPQALLLGTDSGKLYLHDLREGRRGALGQATKTWTPHDEEHVNALCPLPIGENSTSGFPKQWVSVGGTTLAVTDIRKGVIQTSEDQDVELTSCLMVEGLKKGGTSVGQKLLVGQADGVVSLWEKGVWGDLDDRIVIDKTGDEVESMCEVPPGFGKGKLKMNEKLVAAGLEGGRIRFARVGRNGVLDERDIVHDEMGGVIGLGFDIGGRLVGGGGQTIKIWTEAKGQPGGGRNGLAKRNLDSDDSDEDVMDDDSDMSQDDKPTSKRKKRKRNKGKDKSGGKALSFSGLL